METAPSQSEQVTLNDILGLASWNRERSTVELKSFISSREDALDVEDFDF
jgi:hypothetical protein